MRYYGYFHECGPQNVTPLGHLKAILEKQQNLSSHFKEQGYPFDTPMWDGGTGKVVSCPVISHDPTVEIPETWWPYEQSAYLLDGVLRLGILFNDQEKIELFRRNAAYVANHPDQDGLLGHCYPGNNISEWPMAVFFRAVHAYCELTQDEELKKAFISHYTALSAQKICSEFRNICNLEGLLKCYEWSGDDQLLEKALEAFHLYDKCYSPPSENEFELPWSRLTSGRNFVIHGVSFSEFLKLPVMLYLYSGDRKYLDGAEKALADVLARHEQITGLPCSIENFAGRDPLQGYETCVITDFTWALGYFLMASGKAEYADRIEKIIFNALPGAVTEDFCTLQYLSSPNQMVAADYANHSFFLRGTACFRQFRADHRPQCCAGNIHRILPNFAMRSWMVDAEGNPAAVFYVPSSYRGTLHGQEYVITEETSYPDDETIRFRFSMTGSLEMAFSCRIPGWCRNASILINGVPADVAPECGTFCRILRKWHDGDEVTVTLPMEIVQKQDRYWSYYERGPLVYSLPIPFTEVREYQSVYAPRNLLPAGRWNYGVSPGTPASFENGTLRVKGFPVSGFDALVQGRYSPELPLWGKRCGDDEMLTLIPYGQAKLQRLPTKWDGGGSVLRWEITLIPIAKSVWIKS